MQCFNSKVYFCLLLTVINFQFSKNQATIETYDEEKRPTDTERIPLPDKDCPEEDIACIEDHVNLEAIKALHKQLDDDASGNIDIGESQEFFQFELKNTDGLERQSIFHGNDDKISVEDLWHTWKKSKVFNWTVDDVVEWLIDSVELPQYSALFKEKHINGSLLPRVAVNTNHYISGHVGIKNQVHKHKLYLKAIDVVLFGPAKKPHHIMKDIALITSIIVALGGCVFAYRQNKSSKEHLKKMMKDLDSLQKAEDSLSQLNTKLQRAEEEQNKVMKQKTEIEQKFTGEIEKAKHEAERLKQERQGSDLEELSRLQLAEEELIQVRAALRQAETELDGRGFWGAPTELQQWLQYTFELEQQHFSAKQQAAQRQFGTAKDACEKMRRKRTGMLGTFRVAQGNSIDDIDQRILQARMALEEIRHDLQERQQRWQAIESFCGFPIRSNPGIVKLEHGLYSDGSLSTSGSTTRLATSMVAPLNVEDADEDFPPQYPAATAMLFSQKTNGCSRSTASHTGLGSNLNDLKRRQVNMGSSSSLARSSSQILNAQTKRDSLENNPLQKTSSSNGNHSAPVSFQLGGHSPVSSPESPGSDNVFSSELPPLKEDAFTRSRSSSGVSALPNGSRIPKTDSSRIPKPETSIKPSTLSITELNQRCPSDNNLQKRILSKQAATIGGVGANSSQDDDSLSGTESYDSEGRRKDKKKLKFIPKFMRRTDH